MGVLCFCFSLSIFNCFQARASRSERAGFCSTGAKGMFDLGVLWSIDQTFHTRCITLQSDSPRTSGIVLRGKQKSLASRGSLTDEEAGSTLVRSGLRSEISSVGCERLGHSPLASVGR